jgi:hypothetical protein
MIPRQYRVLAGFCLIGAGVIVAIIGYLGVAGETDVAFQLPYFASAGVGALLLMGGGATMLISSQLEADSDRLVEIEEAIRALATEVGRIGDDLSAPRGRRLRAVGMDGHPARGGKRAEETQ